MLSEKDSEELIFNFRKSLNKHISSKKIQMLVMLVL